MARLGPQLNLGGDPDQDLDSFTLRDEELFDVVAQNFIINT